MVVIWLVAVWLLSLLLFVLLMARRAKVAHPRPPAETDPAAWRDDEAA